MSVKELIHESFGACKMAGHVENAIEVKNTNKFNQCDFASSQAIDLRTHLKTHSGQKSNKCNQCDYASSQPGHLRRHLKMHSGEKSNKCNQCNYVSSRADPQWRKVEQV